MLLVSIISFIIIIFPLLLNINLLFIKEHKKLYFTLGLYKISFLSGYVEIVDDSLAIHLSNKKAIIIPFKSFFELEKKIKPLKDYHVIKFKYLVELGSENNMLSSVSIGFIINYVFNIGKKIVNGIKPYVTIDGQTDVYENKNVFNVYIRASVLFNLLMVLLSLIKIILEKIIYAIGAKKKQNQ